MLPDVITGDNLPNVFPLPNMAHHLPTLWLQFLCYSPPFAEPMPLILDLGYGSSSLQGVLVSMDYMCCCNKHPYKSQCQERGAGTKFIHFWLSHSINENLEMLPHKHTALASLHFQISSILCLDYFPNSCSSHMTLYHRLTVDSSLLLETFSPHGF